MISPFAAFGPIYGELAFAGMMLKTGMLMKNPRVWRKGTAAISF